MTGLLAIGGQLASERERNLVEATGIVTAECACDAGSVARRKNMQDTMDAARAMIQRHGLRAQAVALERVQEMRVQGDTEGLDRWQSIYAAICELRRTRMQKSGPEEAMDYRS
jgi:hypothetical protein